MITVQHKRSGTKEWAFVQSDDVSQLELIAVRLNVPIKQDIRGFHLDLNRDQERRALDLMKVEVDDDRPTSIPR